MDEKKFPTFIIKPNTEHFYQWKFKFTYYINNEKHWDTTSFGHILPINMLDKIDTVPVPVRYEW